MFVDVLAGCDNHVHNHCQAARSVALIAKAASTVPDEFDSKVQNVSSLPFVLGQLRRQIVLWHWNPISAQSRVAR